MTTIATQQTAPTPAQRLAQKIRARTNDTRDILDLLHEIAQGEHDATEHDRLTATGILFDRGYGKTPKQAPATADPVPESDDDEAATLESPASIPHKEPDSPKLVTQLDNSLHESLGPAPSANQPTRHSRESGNPESYEISLSYGPGNPDPFDDPSSIQSTIRDHIISITNDGDTLIDVLADIAWPDDPLEPSRKVKPFHRNRAAKMLLERGAGRDPTPILTAVQSRPEPGQSIPPHPDYPPGYVLDPTKSCIYCSTSLGMKEGHEGEHRRDYEALAKARAEIQRMKDEGILTPDPNAPKIDITPYLPPKDWIPNPDVVREEAAKFREELDLRIERRKAWPAIEERRRKKLKQIYPSHSEDGDPPDP